MKTTNLTIPENGVRVWREDAFDDGLSRVDLVKDFEELGFVHYRDSDCESWELWLPEDMWDSCGNTNMIYVDLDVSYKVFELRSRLNKDHIVDGKIISFNEEILIGVTIGGDDTKAFRIGDMWQAIRQQWEKLYHYDAYCKGKHEVESLVREWRIND